MNPSKQDTSRTSPQHSTEPESETAGWFRAIKAAGEERRKAEAELPSVLVDLEIDLAELERATQIMRGLSPETKWQIIFERRGDTEADSYWKTDYFPTLFNHKNLCVAQDSIGAELAITLTALWIESGNELREGNIVKIMEEHFEVVQPQNDHWPYLQLVSLEEFD